MRDTFMIRLHGFLDNKKDTGILLLRILIGWRLIDGTWDNIVSWDRMVEFSNFLSQHNVPYAIVAANVSVYAQFLCGVLYTVGFLFRPSAFIMIINFVVAFFVVHLGTTFQQSFEVLTMLFTSVLFLLLGPGKISFATYLERNSRRL